MPLRIRLLLVCPAARVTPLLASGREMAAGAEALERTPLHDRHVAAGARLVPFAGWEMPVQYAGIRAEHDAVRERAGVFDVSHMGEIETTGPDAEAFLQRILSNDVTKIAEDGAQYSVLCQEDGGRARRPLLLPLGRPLPHRHQRLQPRARPRLVPQARRRASTSSSTTACTTSRCSPSRARRPAGSSPASPTASCPSASAPPRCTVAGRRRRARVRHRLHGRGRRRADRPRRRRDRRVGRGRVDAASRPPAWARATRCAWRSASTSTATT